MKPKKSQAKKCLEAIGRYYADEDAVTDRYERNADNVWGDVILSATGYDAGATEEADPGGNTSTIACFRDGSQLIWDEPTHEWEAYD